MNACRYNEHKKKKKRVYVFVCDTCGLPKASSCSSKLDLARVTSALNLSYSLQERSNSWNEDTNQKQVHGPVCKKPWLYIEKIKPLSYCFPWEIISTSILNSHICSIFMLMDGYVQFPWDKEIMLIRHSESHFSRTAPPGGFLAYQIGYVIHPTNFGWVRPAWKNLQGDTQCAS